MKNIRLFSWKNFVAAVLEDFIGNSYYHAEADAAVEFEIAAKISRLKVFLAQELELPLPPPPESWKVVWISICFAFLLFWCSCSYDKDIGRMLFSLFTSALVASKSCSTQIIQSLHMCVSPVRKWSTHIVEMEIENGLLQKLLNLNATWNIISVYKYHIISPTLAALVSIPTLIIMRKEKVLGLTIYACSIVLFFQFAEFVGVLMVPGFAASFILLFTLFSILSSSCRSFHLACFTFAVATIVIDNELFLNDNFLFLMIISGLFSTLCYDEIMQRIDPDNVLVSCTLRAIVLVFSGLELVQLVLNIATSKVMIGDTDTATTRFSLRSLENASFEDFSKAISSKYALKSIIEVFCPVYATVGIIRALVQRKTKFTHVLLSFALISTASSVASFLTTGSKLLKHTSSSLLTVTASLTWILSEVITKWQESKILESIEDLYSFSDTNKLRNKTDTTDVANVMGAYTQSANMVNLQADINRRIKDIEKTKIQLKKIRQSVFRLRAQTSGMMESPNGLGKSLEDNLDKLYILEKRLHRVFERKKEKLKDAQAQFARQQKL